MSAPKKLYVYFVEDDPNEVNFVTTDRSAALEHGCEGDEIAVYTLSNVGEIKVDTRVKWDKPIKRSKRGRPAKKQG